MTALLLYLLLQVGVGIENEPINPNPLQTQQSTDIDSGWDEGD